MILNNGTLVISIFEKQINNVISDCISESMNQLENKKINNQENKK
jgi:hypothetical protein